MRALGYLLTVDTEHLDAFRHSGNFSSGTEYNSSKLSNSLSAFAPQVTDGVTVMGVSNGHPILQKISAAGCLVTAIIAGFVSMNEGPPLLAACYAMGVFG